jgi:hypothetical protein
MGDAERVCADHHVPWPARNTMIGNFFGDKLRWKVGAAETWSRLLDASK